MTITAPHPHQGRKGFSLLELLAVIVISLSFMVVEQLGAALKNPFESEPNDTPMTALCRTIEIIELPVLQAPKECRQPKPAQPQCHRYEVDQ